MGLDVEYFNIILSLKVLKADKIVLTLIEKHFMCNSSYKLKNGLNFFFGGQLILLFFGSKEEFIQIPFFFSFLCLVPNRKGRFLLILFHGLLKKYVSVLFNVYSYCCFPFCLFIFF